MKGRINSVATSNQGRRFAAGSSLDGSGEVHVYSYDFDTNLTDSLKAIQAKVAATRSTGRRPRRDPEVPQRSGDQAGLEVPGSCAAGVYALAFSPDGKVLASAGADGIVRLVNPENGSPIKEFRPRPRRPGGIDR